MWRLAAGFALALGLAQGSACDGTPSTDPATLAQGTAQGEGSVPNVVPAAPAYPATVQGLEDFTRALVAAIQNDDAIEEARLVAALRLPSSEVWFGAHFDPATSARLVAEHRPIDLGIGHIINALKEPIAKGQLQIRAEEFRAADQLGATGYQSAALAKMTTPVPLYSVRLSTDSGKQTFHLWSFVHHQGMFRFVGKMRHLESTAPPKGTFDPLEFRNSDQDRAQAVAKPPN